VSQELTSEEVHVQVQRKGGCRIEMRVKASPQIVRTARKRAIKAVNKEVSLAGFRKGRAPEEKILKEFPFDVEKYSHKAIADLAFIAAQRIAKVPILNNHSQISFDLKSQSPEEGAEVFFSFETEPEVPDIDTAEFALSPVKRPEIGEKEIEEAIWQMRFFYAQWKTVQRPVQEGDYVMIDLDAVEGENLQKVFRHTRFEVSKERMAGWMKKLVEGAKAGDVLEGVSESEGPESIPPKKVRLTLLKVEEATLPELNDEFAQKVGAVDVAQMRQSIVHLLNRQADEKVETELREQVNSYLMGKYFFELPQSLIEAEKKYRIGQSMGDPQFKASWSRASQEERNKFEEKVKAESIEAVKLFYLSRQIVEKAKIPITHQEVQNQAISIHRSRSGTNAEIDTMPKEIYALALSKVALVKAQDHFIRTAMEKKA